MTKQKELEKKITTLIKDYGKAMQTETEQYPEYIVVFNIIDVLADMGMGFLECYDFNPIKRIND